MRQLSRQSSIYLNEKIILENTHVNSCQLYVFRIDKCVY